MSDPYMVLCVWEDASSDSDVWVDRESPPAAKVVVHQQVGWLLESTSEHVLLTCTISESLMGSRTRIPTGMVRSVTQLQLVKKRK